MIEKEKRTNMMKIMVSDTEKQNITDTVKNLKEKGYQENITASDLIRQSVNKWISQYNRIEEGNVICYLPVSEEIRKNKVAMVEIENLMDSEELSQETKQVLSRVVDALEWQVLTQLTLKYPNNRGMFNLSSLDKDI